MTHSTPDCLVHPVAPTSVVSNSRVGGKMPAVSSSRRCPSAHSGNKDALGIPKASPAKSVRSMLSRLARRWVERSPTKARSAQKTSPTTPGGSTAKPHVSPTSTTPSTTACCKSSGHIRWTSRLMSGACRRSASATYGAKTGSTLGTMPNRTVPTSPLAARRTAAVTVGHVADDGLCSAEKFCARTGECDPAGRSRQQRGAHFALQSPYQLTQRGLRHVESFGGPAEVKVSGHGHEGLELAEFHRRTLRLLIDHCSR